VLVVGVPLGRVQQALLSAAAHHGQPVAGARREWALPRRQRVVQSAQARADGGHGDVRLGLPPVDDGHLSRYGGWPTASSC